MADFNIVEVDADPFSIDRDKLVAANFGQTGVTGTTYYVLIDLDGGSYKHTSGTLAKVFGVSASAFKSNSGAKWAVELLVVLAINATDADLGVLPLGSVPLRDTSKFSDGKTALLFPTFADLEVSGGDFANIANGLKELAVTAVNTSGTLADVFGVAVIPAVGDVLVRANLISGGGTLDFAYGLQYFVE